MELPFTDLVSSAMPAPAGPRQDVPEDKGRKGRGKAPGAVPDRSPGKRLVRHPGGGATGQVTRDFPTPLGPMRLTASGGALTGAWFADQPDAPPPADAAVAAAADRLVLDQAADQLQAWFRRERTAFDVPLALHGTPFQVDVWKALCELPFGTTISYGELAVRVGRPRAVRAVAQAVGRNPVSIIVPCHRIVGHDTSLTGFGGGLPRKRALLDHEGHVYRGGSARSRGVHPGQMMLGL